MNFGSLIGFLDKEMIYLNFSGIREMVYGIYRNNILKNIIDIHWHVGPRE
jgi:hypothetical protein